MLLVALSTGCARSRPIDASRTCAAPAEVEAAWWAAFDGVDEKCGYRAECWRRELEDARALRDRYPEELLAHRLFVWEIVWSEGAVPEVATLRRDAQREYANLARRYPRNPAYPYLSARLAENRKTRRALLQTSVALDPEFPWAHHAWVRELLGATSEDERKQARIHLDAFVVSCPQQVPEILGLVRQLGDRDAWRAVAPSLRERVTPEGDRFADLPELWAAEFRYADPEDYPALRERVRDEIERVGRRGPGREQERLEVLRAGYAITGNEAGQRATDAQWTARFPCTFVATQIRAANFETEHGKFSEADEAAARRWLEAVSAAMQPWLTECPNEMGLWQVRLLNLARWDQAPANDVDQAADRVLALVGRSAIPRVAKAYLDKRIRLDRVAALIDDAARLTEERFAQTQASGLEGEQLRLAKRDRESQLCEEQALRIRLALARRDLGAARLGLLRLSTLVDQARKSAASPRERPTEEEAELWRLQGDADALAGKSEAALASYGRFLELDPDDRTVRKAARALYGKLHGADTDFDGWLRAADESGKTISEESTRAVRRPLPDFSLTDVAGKTWSSAQLRGKAVFMNFWATWCGPCQRELPGVQELYEKMKNRRDVVVLTVSVDQNPGLIQPFLARANYTFPALVGGPGSASKWEMSSIPQTFIVDREGMIVQEQLGFGGETEPWVQKASASLEAALR